MEEYHAIPDDEDKFFTTSLGHWTGDAIWEEFHPWVGYGIASLILPAGITTAGMQLTYPALKPAKRFTHRLRIQANVIPAGPIITLTWGIQDRTHTFAGYQNIATYPNPTEVEAYVKLPWEFEPESAVLNIGAIIPIQEEDFKLSIPLVYLTYAFRRDYLPLTGAG